MKKFLLAAVFALGCSGTDSVSTVSDAGVDGGFNQVGSPLLIKPSSAKTWGIRNDAKRTACDNSSTTQNCYLMVKWDNTVHQNTWRIKVETSTFTDAQKAEVEANVDQFCQSMYNLLNVQGGGSANPFSCFRVTTGEMIVIRKKIYAVAPNANIENFARLTWDTCQQMGESLPGNYHFCGKATIDYDPGNAYATWAGSTSTAQANGRKRALLHYVVAAMGIGAQGTAVGFYSYDKVSGTGAGVLSSEESCRMRKIDYDYDNYNITSDTGC